MSWCSSRTLIRGAGKFIATASRYLSGCEVAIISLNEAPKEPERRHFVSSWRVSPENAQTGARHDHARRQGDVSDDGRVLPIRNWRGARAEEPSCLFSFGISHSPCFAAVSILRFGRARRKPAESGCRTPPSQCEVLTILRMIASDRIDRSPGSVAGLFLQGTWADSGELSSQFTRFAPTCLERSSYHRKLSQRTS
jgi:hypothetical protein